MPPFVVDMAYMRRINRLSNRDTICAVMEKLPESSFSFIPEDTMYDLDMLTMMVCLKKGYKAKAADIQFAMGVWDGEQVLKLILPKLKPTKYTISFVKRAIKKAVENNDRKCEEVLRDYIILQKKGTNVKRTRVKATRQNAD